MKTLLVAAFAAMLALAALPAQAGSCDRCGCRGGPGFRGPDGHCVGKANLTRVCGSPPTSKCKFEGGGKGR